MLRIAGVRQADVKGYSFAREDVNAWVLANAYAQTLGQVFTHEMKPYEVEILVAQVGEDEAHDEMFHILYDGTVMDEEGFTVLGGQADTIAEVLKTRFETGLKRRRRDQGRRRRARARRTRRSPPTSSRSRSSIGPGRGACSTGSRARSSRPRSGADREPSGAQCARFALSREVREDRTEARADEQDHCRPHGPAAGTHILAGVGPSSGAASVASTSPTSMTSWASSIWSSGT